MSSGVLEEDCLINRVEYQQVPPKVEYSLSGRGRTLVPILKLMGEWGHTNKDGADEKYALIWKILPKRVEL